MPGHKKSRQLRSARRNGSRHAGASHGFYTPFSDLDQHLENAGPDSRDRSPEVQPKADAVKPELDEKRLFADAMEGVARLPADGPQKVPHRRPRCQPPRFLAREDREVMLHLQELVRGDARFELYWSDEYLDGAVVGLSPVVLKKLRQGEFSYQAYLDLHGCTRNEARPLVEDFVLKRQARGLRCLLIICGRGLNSKNRKPVLKEHLVRWLTRAPLKGVVLAFSCARGYDGGAGAFYVLLRRSKGRKPVVSPAM